MEKILKTYSQEETQNLGKSLGKLLLPGDFVGLIGDLGAGKTAFTKGIAEGLDIDTAITSPTFTIINEYQGNYDLAHMDAYRIEDLEELHNIGFDDYLSNHIVVMEWANLMEEILPEEVLWIDFKVCGENHRRLKFTTKSPRFKKIIEELDI